ncbi:hypothetical protein K435DRAFT_782491 [Dendrothele bispora CBS 962.96]|uniref:Uncharacterized protein n=1 Tax=Dendrothele bispora (strain CBS 962.96) TaxID=1314807 RepID=A0A4S8LEZ9_DENBC|nr:hypothetical protein K435DRAFT_782491 [Dendrothele bispora CBS 962.96]
MAILGGYGPHLLYSVAVTSLSLHLTYQKRQFSDEKSRVQAQISILESIAEELRSDKELSLDDLARLKRLARPPTEQVEERKMSWTEVVFGKKDL